MLLEQIAFVTTEARWISEIEFSPKTNIMASVERDPGGIIRIWDTHLWKPINIFATDEKAIHGIAFSPDGKFLASAGANPPIKFWDFKKSIVINELQAHKADMGWLRFSPDGKKLMTSSSSVKLWDWENNTVKREFKCTSLAISPDWNTIAVSAGKSIELQHFETGQLLKTLPDSEEAHIIGFRPNKRQLIGTSSQNQPTLWDIDHEENNRLITPYQESSYEIISPDGKYLICGDSIVGELSVWDIDSGERIQTIVKTDYEMHHLLFSPDGRFLVCSGGGGKFIGSIEVWRVNM